MQPYQEAAQEIRRQGEIPKNIISGIGALGASAYAARGIINKVSPFLSKYIPENLAIKGLNKIDPRFGKFIQSAMNAGYDFEELRDFIGNQIEEAQPVKDERNIIQQYSPELHDFISEKVRSGISPVQAGAIAQSDKRFSNIIKKMSKDHKTSWSSILESVFGNEISRRDTLKKFNEKTRHPGLLEQETERFQGQYGQQGEQQQGQGQAALMATLQKLLQARGG